MLPQFSIKQILWVISIAAVLMAVAGTAVQGAVLGQILAWSILAAGILISVHAIFFIAFKLLSLPFLHPQSPLSSMSMPASETQQSRAIPSGAEGNAVEPHSSAALDDTPSEVEGAEGEQKQN